MKNKIINAALAGLVLGIIVAEFFPDLFKNSFGQFAESFSSPFDGHRNHIAMRFGAVGAIIGAFLGYLSLQMSKSKK
jgi:hypothetical protein